MIRLLSESLNANQPLNKEMDVRDVTSCHLGKIAGEIPFYHSL